MNRTNPQFASGGFFTFGLGVVLGFAAPTAMLVASDAEAQTPGMERRQDRRKVATTGVRIGAMVATTGVRIGAEARPTAQRRPTTQKQRSSVKFTRPRTAPEIGHSVLLWASPNRSNSNAENLVDLRCFIIPFRVGRDGAIGWRWEIGYRCLQGGYQKSLRRHQIWGQPHCHLSQGACRRPFRRVQGKVGRSRRG